MKSKKVPDLAKAALIVGIIQFIGYTILLWFIAKYMLK